MIIEGRVLTTVHDDHAPQLFPVKQGPYTIGYFIGCACGFTTGQHERQPAALGAYQAHLLNVGIYPHPKDGSN